MMLDLQIGLSLLIPIGVALALYALEASRFCAPTVQSWRGVVAPYFVAVSTLFGLFGALLVNDVWQGATNAKRAVLMEASAVRDLHLMARAAGIEAALVVRLRAYVKAASSEKPASTAINAQRVETEGPWVAMKKPVLEALQVLDPVALPARTQVTLAARFDELAVEELAPIHQLHVDPVRRQLAEYGAPGIHPFSGPSAAEGALELGGEPGTRDVDLPTGKSDLRLVIGNLLPVAADRLRSNQWRGERRFNKAGFGGKYRQ